MTVSGLWGVLTGGVLVIVILSIIGASYKDKEENPESPKDLKSLFSSSSLITSSPSPSDLSTPSPFGSPSVSPSPSLGISMVGYIEFKKGGFRYKLPEGYRVANDLIKFDEGISSQSTTLTITKGTQKQEQDYINLIKQIKGDETSTEAPQFLPGKTISVFVSSSDAESSDAKLAKSKEEYQTKAGSTANVYRRIEGQSTYDSAYVKLPDGKLIVVQMSYASEAPFFDESAFKFVFDSLISNESF